MARITIASPAWNAAPTLTCWSARRTSTPSPGAPMSAVITTIESAIMIVWLTPMPIVRRASGSWTLDSVCQRVEPSDSAASMVAVGDTADAQRGDPDAPAGSRRSGSRSSPGATPMPKSSVIGSEVGEGRHDLHDVEDRRDRRREPRRPAGDDPERDPDRGAR